MPEQVDFPLDLYYGPTSQKDRTEFWAETFTGCSLTPQDTFSDRIKVCYRLTRALAYWKGIVTDDQTLGEGTHIEPDPWTHSIAFFVNTAPGARWHGMVQVQKTPLPLQPPDNDRLLQRWLIIMTRLARKLHVTGTESGRKGIRWLLDPETVREMWIKPEILMAWETILLSEFLDSQLDYGVYEGQTEMRQKFGLSASECKVLGDLARIAAPDIASDNLETKKALMELRIDKFIRRAREEPDLRAELQGLKLLAVVQGLNKAEPEDDIKGMIEVVAVESKRVNEEDEDDNKES